MSTPHTQSQAMLKHRTGEPEWLRWLCAQEVRLQRYLKQKMSWIEPFALLIHFLAREVGLTFIVCLSLSTGEWKFANQSMFIMCYCELYNAVIKFIVMEPRPIWREDIIVSTAPDSPDQQRRQSTLSRLLRPKAWEPDYSFPSSHSMVMLGLSLSFGKSFGYDSAVFAVTLTLAILGGLTRAYLGQHYFHDVICGWLIELVLAVPMLNAFDSISELPWYALLAIAFIFIPYFLLFDLVIAKFPEHPKELIKDWEDHAKKLSGKKDGKFKTRNPLACGPQAGASFSIFICFVLIKLCGWEDVVYNDKCNSGSRSYDYFVYFVRTVISLPAYIFAAAQPGTRNVFKTFGIALCVVWANLLSFVFLNRIVGLKC